MVINYSNKEIYCNGISIPLAKKEFEIIEFLSLHSGQVFDKSESMNGCGDMTARETVPLLPRHIRRIRSKLGAGRMQKSY